jgi:hypothetical protein
MMKRGERMALTRKDFEGLALVMKEARPWHYGKTDEELAPLGFSEMVLFASRYERRQWGLTCNLLADWCADQNARFNRQKFLAACGVKTDE